MKALIRSVRSRLAWWDEDTLEMYVDHILSRAYDDPMTEYAEMAMGSCETAELLERAARSRYRQMSLWDKICFREDFLDQARLEDECHCAMCRDEMERDFGRAMRGES